MQYDSNKHQRRSIRLPGYDYSQAGYYFVTICCYQRQCLFGEIVDGAMQLNQYGEIVWQRNYYEHIIRDRKSLQKIRQYIANNPLSWEIDQLHPDCLSIMIGLSIDVDIYFNKKELIKLRKPLHI